MNEIEQLERQLEETEDEEERRASMTAHPLPWYAMGPYDGCDGRMNGYTVWDADGGLICECTGEDDGHDEAVAIAEAMNRAGPRVCQDCGKPATCFGSYEDELHPAYACDACCGHGCEDGHCEPVEASISDPRDAVVEAARVALAACRIGFVRDQIEALNALDVALASLPRPAPEPAKETD